MSLTQLIEGAVHRRRAFFLPYSAGKLMEFGLRHRNVGSMIVILSVCFRFMYVTLSLYAMSTFISG